MVKRRIILKKELGRWKVYKGKKLKYIAPSGKKYKYSGKKYAKKYANKLRIKVLKNKL